MKNKMVIIIVAVVVLFGGLFFVTNYKNKKVVDGSDNPYGKDKLNQQTIDSLDDPLYQNIIQPNDLEERIESGESTTVYFFSPDCVHCQRTTPVLVPLAEDNDIDLVQMNLMEFEDEKAESYSAFSSSNSIKFICTKSISLSSASGTKTGVVRCQCTQSGLKKYMLVYSLLSILTYKLIILILFCLYYLSKFYIV